MSDKKDNNDEKKNEEEDADLAVNKFVLKIIGGTLKGTDFPVRKPSFTIGRASEADIQVHDTLISRVHIRITYEDNKWYIEDLNSTNGSWMVGQKISKKVLMPLKTSVRAGKTIFELVDAQGIDESGILTDQTIAYRIRPETLAKPVSEEKKEPSIVRDENKRLSAIYKFQTIISTELEEKKLYPKIIKATFNVIPADEAYLLLYDLESGDFTPVAGRSKDGVIAHIDMGSINKQVVNFVKEKREAILYVEPYKNEDMKGAPDLSKIQTSLMCVPLLGKQQINGMLFLSLTSPIEKYTEDDLRLLTVVGHTSGMAIEHSKMLHFNLKNERLVATGATAAGLSHYIKNILAGLDGSLNLLRLGIDESDKGLTEEAWNILSKNHRRLGNVVLDLLNLASEQKPKLEIHDVNQIIVEVVELLKSQLEQQGIKIVFDGKDGEEDSIYSEVDSKGIHRVLLNLVTNAEHAILSKQKSMDEKDIGEIHLSATLNEAKDYVVLAVKDNGIGMDKTEAKKMFDLFVTSKGSAGTGLGLAVCKRIVEAHSGSITASSIKGEGCTITFSLPVSHNLMNTNTISFARSEV